MTKFSQLQVGQRFEYRGETLIKSGPLTASGEAHGTQRMIAQSATVALPSAAVDIAPTAQITVDAGRLARELQTYHRHCRTLLAAAVQDRHDELAALDDLYRQLCERLGVDAR